MSTRASLSFQFRVFYYSLAVFQNINFTAALNTLRSERICQAFFCWDLKRFSVGLPRYSCIGNGGVIKSQPGFFSCQYSCQDPAKKFISRQEPSR